MYSEDCLPIGIIFAVIGILYYIFPDFFLTFGSKWKYKDSSPSDSARITGAISAALAITIGVILIIYGIFYNNINSFFGF